jgi:demethylspheroidene O-methyltransferase
MLHDLPAVAELARARLATVGLGHRATVTAGDFFTQPLPGGADIVSVIRVLHDHDDGNVVALLRNIRRAIAVNGVLLIAEPMSGMNTDAIGDAYFGFYLLAMGSGRARTPAEFKNLLQQTGFDGGRVLPTRRPMLVNAIVARPIH